MSKVIVNEKLNDLRNAEKNKLLSSEFDKDIDFVLTYYSSKGPNEHKQKYFFKQLREKGLGIRFWSRDGHDGQKGQLKFALLHLKSEFLITYCNLLQISLPLIENDQNEKKIIKRFNHVDEDSDTSDSDDEEATKCKICLMGASQCLFQVCSLGSTDSAGQYTATYRRDRSDHFQLNQITQRQRILIVEYILRNTDFGVLPNECGVMKLVRLGVLDKAYPLHDVTHVQRKSSMITNNTLKVKKMGLRQKLDKYWAQYDNVLRKQPLDEIREYFGEKVALYFAFCGFYTSWLTIFSIMGSIVIIYGFLTVKTSVYTNEMCNITRVMCPSCDQHCNYWHFNETCDQIKFIYYFDNFSNLSYSFIISIWAMAFLQFWKRQNAKLDHKWDLTRQDKDQEPIRPEYRQAAGTKQRINPVTLEKEPYVSGLKRLKRHIISISFVLTSIALVTGTVFAVIIYRLASESLLSDAFQDEHGEHDHEHDVNILFKYFSPSLISSVSASCLSLFLIIVLNAIYTILAEYITNFELPRTEEEYENSLALKVFAFQFVNFYSPLFYIAFFKETMSGHPFERRHIEMGELKVRWQGCQHGGCHYELAIQLIITMVGKQAFNNIKELVLIKSRQFSRSVQWRRKTKLKQWEMDYKLDFDHTLYDEYVEMAIQFGFITLFSTAFPLAPFCALMNNLFEIRMDARKYTRFRTRPVPSRARDIGIWYAIFRFLAILAVITNGLQMAITSNVIPRAAWSLGNNHSVSGYAESTFSTFNTSDFKPHEAPLADHINNTEFENTTECSFIGYRQRAFDASGKVVYNFTPPFSHDIFNRCIFFIIFEHAVLLCVYATICLIPDVPRGLKQKIKRQKFLIQEIMIQGDQKM